MTPASYAVVTPARDEEANLPRLAQSLAAQRVRPVRWAIVENGSTDRTRAVAGEIARRLPWVSVLSSPGTDVPVRGAPIVDAIERGIESVGGAADVVVNVDADVSLDVRFFENLLRHFAELPRLGICGGIAVEPEGSRWRPRFVTGGSVFGPVRAYRSACLADVLPLERRHGWDGLDQLAARARGWETRTFLDLEFRHHRAEGERDGSSWAHWHVNGETAHYMGYRLWYLALRAAFRAGRDPVALAMLAGYGASSVRRRPRWANHEGRALLREDQRLRHLLLRSREARGKVAPRGAPLQAPEANAVGTGT